MTALNTQRLATQAVRAINCADLVARDPAVKTAAMTALTDIAQAFRSSAGLIREVRQAWYRHLP